MFNRNNNERLSGGEQIQIKKVEKFLKAMDLTSGFVQGVRATSRGQLRVSLLATCRNLASSFSR
jgi:hypothetical protein